MPEAAIRSDEPGIASMSKILIGTSGWTYDSWRGPFYPCDVPKRFWLEFYATQFSTTEINGSFYRTPSLEAVVAWRDQTPDDFLFAWKASKFITHWKRLSEKCENSIALMETRLRKLGRKVGPVLFQLPPQFTANRERLASFIRMLPPRRRYAFEFRHHSWYNEAILALLRDNDISLCLSDHYDAPAPWKVTASFVYVRGHGPGGHYRDNYPDAILQAWAQKIRTWKRQCRDVFVYFDNDQKSAAPIDARRLLELTSARPGSAKARARKLTLVPSAAAYSSRSPPQARAEPQARPGLSRPRPRAVSSRRRA
jgi:uncharacterized protein YecE (DUF72 family)